MPRPPTGMPLVPTPRAPQRKERADAARNRQRVLLAAEELFARRSVESVTMDDIAAAAGVGKGTLYRRFTDKGGLAAELLSERGAELQRAILEGPAPLGPGPAAGAGSGAGTSAGTGAGTAADPAARLEAFCAAYLAFQERHLDLVLLSETSSPGGRLRKRSYEFWRQHAEVLLRAAHAPDARVRAEVLLAALSAEQVRHWTRNEGRTLDDLTVALTGVVRSLISSPAA